MAKTLALYLHEMETTHAIDPRLTGLINHLAETCKEISFKVSQGALAGILGSAGSENVQGETQKKLDIIANEIMCRACTESGFVSAVASEEMDHALQVPADAEIGPYLVLFDPLDGSSNIDINVSIGTIFSILPAGTPHRDVKDEEFLQSGRHQLAAGYVIYGPQTQLVLTLGLGVMMFTLDTATGNFYQTAQNVVIDESTKEFAINCSNMRHWEAPVQRYVTELLAGKTGIRQNGQVRCSSHTTGIPENPGLSCLSHWKGGRRKRRNTDRRDLLGHPPHRPFPEPRTARPCSLLRK